MRRQSLQFPRVHRLVLCVVTVSLLAGCGFKADQSTMTPDIGVTSKQENVGAFNVAVVTNGSGSGLLVGTLINTGPTADTLVDARITSERGPVQARLDQTTRLRVDEPVRLATQAAVAVASEALLPGTLVEVRLQFARSAPVTVLAPVETNTGPYSDVPVE